MEQKLQNEIWSSQANHPVQDLKTLKVSVTSQNHGFTVEEDSLPEDLKITHKSLFDGTVQGIEHTTLPAFSFKVIQKLAGLMT